MSSKNPILSSSVISNAPAAYGAPMTVNGAVHKTGILLGLVVLSSAFAWNKASHGGAEGWILAGAILGMIAALVTCFKKEWAPVTAPAYALCEGLFVGGDAKLLWYQFVASAVTLVFSFVVSFIIAKAIDKAIGMRVTEEEENEGLDYSQHAETAYSFGSTGSMDRL